MFWDFVRVFWGWGVNVDCEINLIFCPLTCGICVKSNIRVKLGSFLHTSHNL